ncbi:MAG: glycosyltransferase family 4 protein [Saprospiraceae bacterium]
MGNKAMNIALVSYEFPGEMYVGGIGTYMGQIAKLLTERGHHIEVFCGGLKHFSTYHKEGITIHPVLCKDQNDFRKKVLPVFQKRVQQRYFDIIEAAESSSDSLLIREQFPEIPHVIKLHCPAFWFQKINSNLSLLAKIRFRLGGLRRGAWQKKVYWKYIKEDDSDFHMARLSPYIIYPSNAVKKIVLQYWGLHQASFIYIPNPYIPSPAYLNLSIKNMEDKSPAITFIGRLEKGKGLVELGEAMIYIFRKFPKAKLTLAGAIKASPKSGQNMQQYLEKKLNKYKHQLNFLGHLEFEQMPSLLSQTDIMVIPSHWDNFPTVCLEAMSAGRAVVGSKHGGMSELLAGNCGVLVDPFQPKLMAIAIEKLILNPDLRNILGQNARAKILSQYNGEKIGTMTEEAYTLIRKNWNKGLENK